MDNNVKINYCSSHQLHCPLSSHHLILTIICHFGDLPGRPVAKTPCFESTGVHVWPLVRELDSIRHS